MILCELFPYASVVYDIFMILYTLTIVGTIVIILSENRNPLKSLGWATILVLMPIVGILLYLLFGRRLKHRHMISRKKLRKLRSDNKFTEESPTQQFSDGNKQQAHLAEELTDTPIYKGNNVEIFTDGKSKFEALLNDIAQAKHFIHLQYYIIENDATGRRLSELLIAKAKEGVNVRILYDHVGSYTINAAFFKHLRKNGVEASPFLKITFTSIFTRLNWRNHRKIVVIDGNVGYIGGMNIADRYISGANGQDWHDTHLRIKGNAVHGLQSAFLADWFFMDRKLITDHKYYPQPIEEIENNCFVQVVTSSSASKWCNIMQGYVNILNNAKKYVYMETPYFLPTPSVLSAMQSAALSGVDVRIVVPEKSDNWLVDVASRSFYPEVLKAGVKVYKYTKGFNHSKLLVCDDSLSTVGSTNIDARSFETNMEANAFIYDSDTAIRLRRVFENDLAESKIMAGYPREATFFVRLWESAIRLLAPLL